MHRLQVAQSLRRALYERPYLSAGVRRIRWLARTGAGSIRRCHRRADRDGRHGSDEGRRSKRRCRKVLARGACCGRTTAVRAIWKDCRTTSKLRSANVPDTRDGRGGRRQLPGAAERRVRRRAGSSIRPRIGWRCASTSAVRACSMSSAISAPGAGRACAPAQPRSPAWIPRQLRSKACRRRAAANGLKPARHPRRCIRRDGVAAR